MQTLILSCNTGAGHNSCAQAVQEAYHSRGEICNITDSLQFISEKASTFISNWHTRIYRHAPAPLSFLSSQVPFALPLDSLPMDLQDIRSCQG